MVVICVVVDGSIRCSVCDSTKDNGAHDCVSRPPAAQLCEGYDYCIVVAKYTSDGQSHALHSFIYIAYTSD